MSQVSQLEIRRKLMSALADLFDCEEQRKAALNSVEHKKRKAISAIVELGGESFAAVCERLVNELHVKCTLCKSVTEEKNTRDGICGACIAIERAEARI